MSMRFHTQVRNSNPVQTHCPARLPQTCSKCPTHGIATKIKINGLLEPLASLMISISVGTCNSDHLRRVYARRQGFSVHAGWSCIEHQIHTPKKFYKYKRLSIRSMGDSTLRVVELHKPLGKPHLHFGVYYDKKVGVIK
jgi:hypothetical protein